MNSRLSYLIELSQQVLGETLYYIIETDSYLRQPCYSSRARQHFYFILSGTDSSQMSALSYIQAEFTEYVFNFLTQDELTRYPAHCRWQFKFASVIYSYNKRPFDVTLSKEVLIVSLGQAVIGVGHIARLYYLRDLSPKAHTWAVRQFGWALRCAEYGIVKLWNYYLTQQYARTNPVDVAVKIELEWLYKVNEQWVVYEKKYLADQDAYKDAALMLNRIVQYFSTEIASKLGDESAYILESSATSYDPEKFGFITSFRKNLIESFEGNLKSFYLSGSAARGDQHETSDIDSIAVFECLDSTELSLLREIQLKYPNTSVYTLSDSDLRLYPAFRYYTLVSGTKKMYGSVSLDPVIQRNMLRDSCLNNLYIIMQISRDYLIRRNAGPRALHLLKLMAKLSDHGVLRLIMQYQEGSYPDKKLTVFDYFQEMHVAKEIMQFVLHINERYIEIVDSVQAGSLALLFNLFAQLESFASSIHRSIVNKELMLEKNNVIS